MPNHNDHGDVRDVPKSSKLNARGQPWQPGDLILYRYLPNATEEEREVARENLRKYMEIVFRIATRLATEEFEERMKKFDSR